MGQAGVKAPAKGIVMDDGVRGLLSSASEEQHGAPQSPGLVSFSALPPAGSECQGADQLLA